MMCHILMQDLKTKLSSLMRIQHQTINFQRRRLCKGLTQLIPHLVYIIIQLMMSIIQYTKERFKQASSLKDYGDMKILKLILLIYFQKLRSNYNQKMKYLFALACLLGFTSADQEIVMDGTLKSSHFWDCNGGACDAKTLQPWDQNKYRYAGTYAPIDPVNYGGPVYGQKLWMTGAASDTLSQMMGADDGCCGTEASGACGKCLLVTNPTAVNSGWSAVVMKKNRCPPWSHGCQAGVAHFDLAAPGYDNLQYSTANICGQANTILSKAQSSVCGDWWTRGSSTIKGCSCASLPSGTNVQKVIKRGCQLFTAWGWTSGDPQLTYKVVTCPPAFKNLIHNSFDKSGPTNRTNQAEPFPQETIQLVE